MRVRGVVQGVGFRPFVHRLAQRHGLHGWVRNDAGGVEIHVEGSPAALSAFVEGLQDPPPAAHLTQVDVVPAGVERPGGFVIRESRRRDRPTARISPDLSVCDACRRELLDPSDRRYGYPYLNCTNCGPRYSIITALPYDRAHTTMAAWPLCQACAAEYHDPADRRFHAQPTACPACGPRYELHAESGPQLQGRPALEAAAALLRAGKILAVKGLGGYHLACDARQAETVRTLRRRKVREEKPFALMVPDVETARRLVRISDAEEALLTSTARPIVLMAARNDPAAEILPGDVAPDNRDLGLMLPYTPLHVVLFALGAPSVLVMTSANRASEPMAYLDDDARDRLTGIADAFLAGERPIARRIDDSVARVGPRGPVVLRRARGYAPSPVPGFPTTRPILAVGADLKNALTLVVGGEALMGPFNGDLEHYEVRTAFEQAVADFTTMYDLALDEAIVAHDAHPHYQTTALASELPGEKVAVQHHRAHVASVLAERQAWDEPVVGFAFDGTGYGDDGSIWGGEVFVGSLRTGLTRVAHLLPAQLPGGDASARMPVQAAAGFLSRLDQLPDLTAPPFSFPDRYQAARELVQKQVRTFPTTSAGRLFDTVAALLGFTRPIAFEGQAAIWLEHLARSSPSVAPYPFPGLDFRPLLQAVIEDRLRGRPVAESARAFHRAVALGVVETGRHFCAQHGLETLVLSGGVFQNELLLRDIAETLHERSEGTLSIWINQAVPANDGGISLGQAALAAFSAAP